MERELLVELAIDAALREHCEHAQFQIVAVRDDGRRRASIR